MKANSSHILCKYLKKKKNIARIANAVPVTLYSRITVNVEIVVRNIINVSKVTSL